MNEILSKSIKVQVGNNFGLLGPCILLSSHIPIIGGNNLRQEQKYGRVEQMDPIDSTC